MPARSRGRPARVALALAGGGPVGAVYEIGALCALQEALEGIELTRLQHYVGVSAGGFVAAALANGIPPRDMAAGFVENRGTAVFDPAWLTRPAWREYLRGLRWPSLATLLPNGLCSSDEMHDRLEALLAQPGRSNDFRALAARLSLVATELDSGRPVVFGAPGHDHVPISRAVQATCALPGLFPPVEIEGRAYVDGALAKTLHASAALREGVDLLLAINPLVPFSRTDLARGGLPAVVSQSLRTLIHSRLHLALRQYGRDYPACDIVLLEPAADDPVLAHVNPFSYRQRRQVAEHAYQHARAWLRGQAARLEPILHAHGIRLRHEVLQDGHRCLVTPPAPPHRLGTALTRLGATLDVLDRHLQAA